MTTSSDEQKDIIQVGLSPDGKAVLKEMEDQGIIGTQLDGYLLAIALAVSARLQPSPDRASERETMYSMGSVDPDGNLRLMIRELYPQAASWAARAAESLAEQGVGLLANHKIGDEFRLSSMCPESSATGPAE
jgi:hypothetical protein